MHTDPWKQAHSKAHIFGGADGDDFDAQRVPDQDGNDYKLDYGDDENGILDWYTNFPNQDSSVPNLGKTCLFSMVRLATELERIFRIMQRSRALDAAAAASLRRNASVKV